MLEWVRMPSNWVRDPELLPLKEMKWQGDKKADQIAALMLYIVIVHHASAETSISSKEAGMCRLTYSELNEITGLSRGKISGGLQILYDLILISKNGNKRKNVYKVENFSLSSGWAKLPAKGLYNKDLTKIQAFHDFHSRKKNELNALKLYFLIITFRDNKANYAKIGYDKITEYSGVHQSEIKSAISLLINHQLITLDTAKTKVNDYSSANLYRLNYIDRHKHRGTSSEAELAQC